MPPFRPPAQQPARGSGAAALAALAAGQRVPNTLKELIADAGGTRSAGRLLGKSQRQMQRWAAGEVHDIPTGSLRRLAQAGHTARMNRVIKELGGAKRVAEITGRHVSTVRDWASGRIRMPKPDARQKLGRADVALRMKAKGITVDPVTGIVAKPTYLQLKGDVRVKGTSKSLDQNVPGKNIGAWGGIQISPETMRDVVDALGVGNYPAAHQALEEYLSTNYANCGGYDLQQGIGFFIDRIDTLSFSHDLHPTPSPPRTPPPAQPPRP